MARIVVVFTLAAVACARHEPPNLRVSPSPSVKAPPAITDAGVPATDQPKLESAGTILTRATREDRPRCRVLAVGDSLTDPKSHGGGYLEGLRRFCGCEITNIAKGGTMVNQIRRQLVAHLAQEGGGYSHLVVFGGVNDLYSDLTANRTVPKISADLELMYRAAHAHGMRVLAITVAPWGGFKRFFTEQRWQNTRSLNRWIRESQRQGLTDWVVDAEQLLQCGERQRLCDDFVPPFNDGLHFGPLGHRRLSAALVQALGPGRCPNQPDRGPGGR